MKMTAIWNSRKIPSPPWVTLPVEKSAAKNDTYKSTWKQLQSAVDYFTSHIPFLSTELQLLDKIVYKQKLRSREKVMCYVKQLKKCLSRFIEVDVANLITRISDSWPSPDEVRIATSHVYVPSRQQIHYTMVRLVGAACLVQQTTSYALQTFELSLKQIKIGMFAGDMVVFCATAGRIWFLSHSLSKHLSQLYTSLQVVSVSLEATKVEWLDVSDLPKSLDLLMEDEFAELETRMKYKKSEVDKLLTKFDFSSSGVEEKSSQSSYLQESNDEANILAKQMNTSGDMKILSKKLSLSEDLGIPIKRKKKKGNTDTKDTSMNQVVEGRTAGDLLKDEGWEDVMDVSNVEGVYEENENYRQPMATSTPAPNHPQFGNHAKSSSLALLEKLTEINKKNEDSFSASVDFNLKNLKLEIKKCKSIPKLLAIVKNNESTIDRIGKEKFEQCVRKVRKFRKKAKEEVDQRERLLKRAKNSLKKDLSLEMDEEVKPLEKKDKKVTKRIFVVADKKDLKRVLADNVKKQLGLKKVHETLLQNKGKFKVAGTIYQMRPNALEILGGIVRKLSMKLTSKRTNLTKIVNTLVSLFKREIASAVSEDTVLKVKKDITGNGSQSGDDQSFKVSSEKSVNKNKNKRKGNKTDL